MIQDDRPGLRVAPLVSNHMGTTMHTIRSRAGDYRLFRRMVVQLEIVPGKIEEGE